MSPAGERLAARLLGVALVLAACDPPAALHASVVAQALVVLAAGVAWWAAPLVDERPVRSSTRPTAMAARRRTTLLAAGAVVIAAGTEPPTWLAVCVAVLLLAYLLVTDPWLFGATVPRGRPAATPPLIAAAAGAVVFLAAQAPVADTSWARLPAALAVAATVTCLALSLRHRRD